MYIVELTERQKEIWDMNKQNMSAREIADKLGTSTRYIYKVLATVKKKINQVPNGKYKITIKNENINHQDKFSEQFYNSQISYWKKKYNELKNTGSLEQRLIDLFKESIDKYQTMDIDIPIPESTKMNEELVLLISDIHAGEEISLEETLGLNEYNINIMKSRINSLTSHILDITNKMNKQNTKLNIWMLGDMVSGLIHEELLQGTTIVDEILILSESLSNMIKNLLKVFPEIEVACVIGNHGRMKKKPYYKKKYNNFDYLVYKYLEIKFENINNVKFIIPKSSMLMVQKYDYNFLLMHGDSKVRSYAGIPFYGIRRADSQVSQLLTATKNIYPNYIVMGHFHSANTLEKIGGKIIMNGCLSGTNEHSIGTIFTGTEPKQCMFSINEKFGVNWLLDVFVD